MLARVTAQPDHRNWEAGHDLPHVQAYRTAPVPLSSNRARPQTKRTTRVSADQAACDRTGITFVMPSRRASKPSEALTLTKLAALFARALTTLSCWRR